MSMDSKVAHKASTVNTIHYGQAPDQTVKEFINRAYQHILKYNRYN